MHRGNVLGFKQQAVTTAFSTMLQLGIDITRGLRQ